MFLRVVRVLAIIGFLLALLPWPLNYYEVLRCFILVVSLMEAWQARRSLWALAFIADAIVFNPFYVWPFERWEWSILDVASALLFASGFIFRKRIR